jgi:mannose-6-phosphate isomerase-like protein (cupin superfamily)
MAAHVTADKIGGCAKAGVLSSDHGNLNTRELFVECVHRMKSALPYAPETHAAAETEVFYVISGEATFVSGGKVVQSDRRGRSYPPRTR